MKKIVIAGATGFIGEHLTASLLNSRYALTLLTRDVEMVRHRMPAMVKLVEWNGRSLGLWARELDGAYAVINLAGENIMAKRWTETQKQKIVESRVRSTKVLCDAIDQAGIKPKVFMNASAVGYYGNVVQELNEEAKAGRGFLAETCLEWEGQAKRAKNAGLRIVFLRMGVVLSRNGGALPKVILPFRFFIGGYMGTGKQWFPWIHIEDVIGAIMEILENPKMEGPINLVAPQSVVMRDFCSALGIVLRRPSWFHIPGWFLRILLGETASVFLQGQRVRPDRLIQIGYKYRYPNLEDALESVLHQ